MIKNIEDVMYQMSDFFMAPVLVLLLLLFAYSVYQLGSFMIQAWQRHRNHRCIHALQDADAPVSPVTDMRGYALVGLYHRRPSISRDELDVAAMELLEGVRTVSRLAPMLGLIATMVPMGPALKSLANGNIQGISENLIVAFSAVIFGLVIASITFWIASVKKRWLAAELVLLAPLLNTHFDQDLEEDIREAA